MREETLECGKLLWAEIGFDKGHAGNAFGKLTRFRFKLAKGPHAMEKVLYVRLAQAER